MLLVGDSPYLPHLLHPLNLTLYSGIHGEPLKPWDTNTPKAFWYCAHGEPTFATWHRPYVLLYEQRLHEIMCSIIPNTFAEADHTAMFHAADTWRLPYWDWAIKKPDWDPDHPDSPKNLGPLIGPNVPFLLTQQEVEVKTLTGVAPVANPMWKYEVPNLKTFGIYGITDVSDDKGGFKRVSCFCLSDLASD